MNKKKLYNLIMESVSKELQNILLFNNSDIFNKEESYYDGSNIFDNYIYKNILKKLLNAELVFKEELEYVYRLKKYKVNNKKELRNIIEKYSEKNPTGSLNWVDTSRITDMSKLFQDTKYDGDISEWDTSNVTNMLEMFNNAKSFNQPIGDWDVSNVTNMSFMFNSAESFNQPIGDWDVSKVTNMNCMFYHAESFNQPIGDWDVSNVIDMEYMFWCAKSFNKSIKNWDVNNETNIENIFYNCNIKDEYKPNFDDEDEDDEYFAEYNIIVNICRDIINYYDVDNWIGESDIDNYLYKYYPNMSDDDRENVYNFMQKFDVSIDPYKSVTDDEDEWDDEDE